MLIFMRAPPGSRVDVNAPRCPHPCEHPSRSLPRPDLLAREGERAAAAIHKTPGGHEPASPRAREQSRQEVLTLETQDFPYRALFDVLSSPQNHLRRMTLTCRSAAVRPRRLTRRAWADRRR